MREKPLWREGIWMRALYSKIKNMIKVARLLSTIDDGDLRLARAQYFNKNQIVGAFSPYGLMHNPPIGSLGLLFSVSSLESHTIGIFDDPNNRTLKGLGNGEVAIGNYGTGDYVHFRNGQIIKVRATGNMEVEADNDVIINVGNNITAVANDSVTLTAPTVTINGNVTVNGNVSSTGTISAPTIAAGSSLTVDGLEMGTHRHGGVQTGTGISGGPQAGP